VTERCLGLQYQQIKSTLSARALSYLRHVEPTDRIRFRLLSGVFWTMVMSCVVQGSTFLASIATARLLGYESFGKFAMIQSMIITVANFAGIGLSPTATKFVSELRCQSPDRTGRILGLCSVTTLVTGIVFAISLILLAPWLARDLLQAGELATQIRIGAIYVLLYAMNAYQIGALSGFEAFARIARISAVQGPLILTLTIVLIWPLGLNGAVLAMVVSMIASWILYQRALHAECKRYSIRIKYYRLYQEASTLTQVAIPAAISGLVGGFAVMGANVMLVRQPSGFTQMAIFNAANCFRMFVVLVPGMVTRVSAPILCNLGAARDMTQYRRTFWICLGCNLVLSTSVALVLFLGAYPLLRLFGKEFSQGQGTLGLLLAASVVEILAIALYQPLFSHDRLWMHVRILSIWSALLIAGTWFWVAKGGATALAAAYLIAWMCSAVLYALITRNILRAEPDRNLETHVHTI
jgi:O-antigen/teichoic acid export membrane protein